MSHRPLVPILFSLIAGILIGHAGLSHHPSLLLLLFPLVALSFITTLFVSSRFRFPSFILLFLLAGALLDLNGHREPDILFLANQREHVSIEGILLEPGRILKDMAKLVVRADVLWVHGKSRKVREKLLVTLYSHARDFAPGVKIRFPARLRPFQNFNNPGYYNYEMAMYLRGFSCAASVSDGRRIVPMGRGDLGFFLEMLEKARRPIRALFQGHLSPRDQALFRALILGERQGIDPGIRETFNIAGLGHILAVSGLHIGLVAWLAFSLFRVLLSLSYRLSLQGDIRKLAAIMTFFPVVAYAFVAGFQVSSQRAMMMVLAYVFSMILGRDKEVWSTLALAAFVVLAIDPHALFSVSFQLSFLAVTGILWLGPAIYKKTFAHLNEYMKDWKIIHRVWIYLGGLVSVTLSAIIFLLPVTSFYFHRISLVAIPANLMVVPLLGLWIIPLGLMAALSLPISSSLANIFLQLGVPGMEGMIRITQFWAQLPGAAFWVLTPNILETLLFYALVFFILFLRRWGWAKWAVLVLVFFILADSTYWVLKTRFNQDLKVTYLDVGQGNSALIQFPGRERMLIDGGGFSRGEFDTGRMVVAPFLFHSKMLRVDYLVLSHPQSDHMNGLRFIASNFRPKEFWYNGYRVERESFKGLMKIVDANGTKKFSPADLRAGRKISGVKIELLYPVSDEKGGRSLQNPVGLNNRSLVLKFSYGGKSLLFPGDLEKAGERMVISRAGSRLRSDILLAPHHGSKHSCSEPFLQRVRPRICIISSGRGNRFGFPHAESLRRLQDVGCNIMRIDQLGALQLSVGHKTFEVTSFLKGPLKAAKKAPYLK